MSLLFFSGLDPALCMNCALLWAFQGGDEKQPPWNLLGWWWGVVPTSQQLS